MIDGKEHLERKKLFSTLFSKGAMVYYETQLLEPVIGQVMAELSARRGADGFARTDLVPLVRIMLHRISAKVVGIDGVDTPERTERFRVMIANLSDAAAGQWAIGDRDELMRRGWRRARSWWTNSCGRRLNVAARLSGSSRRETCNRAIFPKMC